MEWIHITAQDFEDGLLPAEVTALNAIKERDGRTAGQQLNTLITRACNTVRGYCPHSAQRGASITVDGVVYPTIPEEFADAALAMIRAEYFACFPELASLWTDARNNLYLQGIRRLELWAAGKYGVSSPDTPAPAKEQGPGPGAIVVTRMATPADSAATSGLL